MASMTSSCSQRLIRRSMLAVQFAFTVHRERQAGVA
jgi:hypothetical protein